MLEYNYSEFSGSYELLMHKNIVYFRNKNYNKTKY